MVLTRSLAGPQFQLRGAPRLGQQAEIPVDVEPRSRVQQVSGEGIGFVSEVMLQDHDLKLSCCPDSL